MKNLYPKWFPYPSSWLRAIVTILILGPIGILLCILGFWFGSFALLFGGFGGTSPWGLVAFWTIVLGFMLVPVTLITYIHHLLTLVFSPQSFPEDRPRWQPRWISWQEGITGVITIGVSFAIASFFVFLYRPDLLSAYNTLAPTERNFIFKVGTGIWIAAAAYLYHWDYLVRDKRKLKQQAKIRQKLSERSDDEAIDETDIEFRQR
jgi:hypothetical protein